MSGRESPVDGKRRGMIVSAACCRNCPVRPFGRGILQLNASYYFPNSRTIVQTTVVVENVDDSRTGAPDADHQSIVIDPHRQVMFTCETFGSSTVRQYRYFHITLL